MITTTIAPPPASYEAYLYKYTNSSTGRIYVGIHKGSVDDEYNHSSTNAEFKNAFANSQADLNYEVLSYGDWREMQNAEHNILQEDDARNNPIYYNKTNGYPVYSEPNLAKCKAFVEDFQSGMYDVGKEPIGLHVGMPAVQVRFETDAALIREIKEKVDDANGNTDKCSPVLVWVERGPDGEDLRGDSNHTVTGIDVSKHGIDIPVSRVPVSVHQTFSTAELKLIGNLLNKKPEITKKPIDAKTGVKFCFDNYIDYDVPYDSQSNKDALKAFGFTKDSIKTIIKNTKTEIDKDNLRQSNRLFINYKAEPFHQTMLDTVTAMVDSTTCSLYMSSAKFSSDRVLETIYAANDAVGKTTVIVVIHHPSPTDEELWKTKFQPKWIALFKFALQSGINVKFHEMVSTMSDGTV